MELLSQAVAVGGKAIFPQGKSFLLSRVDYAVNVKVYGENNKLIGQAEGIEEGLQFDEPGGFVRVEVESPTNAQTIEVLVSQETVLKYNRLKGDVNIDGNLPGIDNPIEVSGFTSTPTVKLDNASAPAAAYLNSNLINTYSIGGYVASYSGRYSIGQIWNPAASGYNIWLTHLDVMFYAGGYAYFTPVKRTTALTSLSDIVTNYSTIRSCDGGNWTHPFTINHGHITTNLATIDTNCIGMHYNAYYHNSVPTFSIDRPFKIPPSRGIIFIGNVVSREQAFNMQFQISSA